MLKTFLCIKLRCIKVGNKSFSIFDTFFVLAFVIMHYTINESALGNESCIVFWEFIYVKGDKDIDNVTTEMRQFLSYPNEEKDPVLFLSPFRFFI